MAVRILILRTITKDQEAAVRPLLKELHAIALRQPGYISGESLIYFDNPEDHLVISSWESRKYWEDFLEDDKSTELHNRVNQILARETQYRIYYKG
ncbi:MAG: hypothetical protein GY866_23700 [Proteobacteria bacterium]|nr:hypothetical protein [Pseudomonadota bacterium]